MDLILLPFSNIINNMNIKGNKKLILIIIFAFAISLFINAFVLLSSFSFVTSETWLSLRDYTILVLWAWVRRETPSPILKERLDAGFRLYEKCSGCKLLLSWDHSQKNYDEVNVMRKYILSEYKNKVKEEDIFMDHAWFDTYDSIYRAKEIFDVRKIIIVTQYFHVYRSVYLARSLWMEVSWFWLSYDSYLIVQRFGWNFREYFSRIKAFSDILFNSNPKYLWPKIPISWNWRITWDKK